MIQQNAPSTPSSCVLRLVFALPILLLVLAAGAAPAQTLGWKVEAEEHQLPGSGVWETVWSAARPPGGEYDRIAIHRYRLKEAPKAALLYLPGTNMNGAVALDDERYNLWLFLARRGVAVYTLDYRTHAVPAEGVEDFGFLKEWGIEAFTGDALAAARFVRRDSRQPKLFLAGFSRGVAFAYALAAASPEDFAGVVALDGYLKHHAPRQADRLEETLKMLEAAGEKASRAFRQDLGGSRGWTARQALMTAVMDNPAGPALEDQRPEAATAGEQLATLLYHAWGPGRLANPLDGVSRPEVLARLLAGYDRFYPTVQEVEGEAISHHKDAPFTEVDDGWAALRVPVIYFGTTGMGPEFLLNGIHSAAQASGGEAEIHVLEGWGHLDVLVAEKALEEVFEPVLAWILPRIPEPLPEPAPHAHR